MNAHRAGVACLVVGLIVSCVALSFAVSSWWPNVSGGLVLFAAGVALIDLEEFR